LLLALAGLLVTPGHARGSTSYTIIDDHHTAITFTSVPKRIISLAPNVTEILFALDVGSEVVGASSYSDYPAAAKKIPVVFTYSGASYEKIVALKPDLIVSAAIVPQSVVLKLRALHLKVLVTDPQNVEQVLSDIGLVGVAVGKTSTAISLVRGLQKRIDAVTSAIASVPTRPTVYYELDKTLYTAGHGSFVDSLITMAGGANIAGGINNPYPRLSAERIIRANPQFILLGDAAYGVTPSSVASRPGWKVISAVAKHKVFAFDDNLVSRPGPRIVLGLESLAHLLHPEAFR
jgi:iron complex transport system substrate-binding protein